MNNYIEDLIEKPNDIYKFLEKYISVFNAGWKAKLQPASEEEISNLKKVSGFEELGYDIPDEYLAFLRYMGKNDGGLISDFFEGYTDIDNIINYYISDREVLFQYFIQKNQLILYIGYISGEPDLFIDVKNNTTHDIHWSSENECYKDTYAESFDKFLMQITFMTYEQKKYKNKIYFNGTWQDTIELIRQYGNEKIMRSVCQIAENQGFKTAWFSDKWHYCGFKENSYLFVYRDFGFYGYVVSNNMDEVGNIVNDLNNLLNTKVREMILE